MPSPLDEVKERVSAVQAQRRTLLKAGGVASALLATGLPAYAFADQLRAAHAQPTGARSSFRQIPVQATGSANSQDGSLGVQGALNFSGTLDIVSFFSEGGQNYALGIIDGEVKDATGKAQHLRAPVAGPVSSPARPAAAQAAAPAAPTPVECGILTLVLGPLNLNLLGLVITIRLPIILNITAVPGNGNLLGNLLCAIVNLLNRLGIQSPAAVEYLNALAAIA